MKKRNKILFAIPLLLLLLLWTITTAQTSNDFQNSSFYKKIQQLEIPVWNILLWKTLTRYDFTRLLNAIECQDCIMPDATMVSKYNEESWQQFQQLPWKYFEDIEYLSWTHNWTNYYYCVANIWSDDIMNWYPRGTSICWWKFCWQRNVTKAEFFQTLSNFLMDRNMFNYSAQWWEIKKWYNKLKTNEPWYKYLNTAQIALIKTKGQETEQITTRLEYTTYLAYCTFNPWACWFQTFPELSAGNWPIAETNVLIRAWIITTDDVFALNSSISPADALEKMWITYDRHIKCEFDSDYDCDQIPNHSDNCPYDYNPTQNDFDGDAIWDVCDDDIDWDGETNPVWFVDDNWTINYWLLKTYKTADKTPFWEQMEDTAYFIKVDSISQGYPVSVQFGIAWPEDPMAVEWDFWDLWKWKWKTVSHNFNWQWVYTITAKLTTKSNRKHILTTQIFVGQTTDTSYTLYIWKASINKDTATFEAITQWKYDYLEWENKATGEKKQLKWGIKFTTQLVPWVRNNIVLKGYANDTLAASASTDVYESNWKFYTLYTVFAPQLKSVNNSITSSISLVNIPLNSIENIAWELWDWTSLMDKKITNKHVYQSEWKKIVIQRVDLSNWEHLYATSTINIQDPSIMWTQTYNVLPSFTKKSVKLIFNNKWLSIKDWDILSAVINTQQEITLDKPKENASFLELADKQGVVKVNVKLRHWSLLLENNWVITFWLKDQTALKLDNIDSLFSWLKCDLDKDWIPDVYDGDVDWDGIPNLLGLVTKEREDCRLVVWENVNKTLYEKHFWICSLDNCPFRANPEQTDLNVNGIWDLCEWNWECWNKIIDLWETCKTCKEDVWTCTAFCWNWKQEEAENCKNCPTDMKVCPSTCWNGLIDSWEQCDHWDKNWKDWECTIACKNFDYSKPDCWNGIYDEWEDCISCPVDLWDICIDDWIVTCWDEKIDPGENCINCPNDVGNCTAFCWNGIVEEAENCSNCEKDIWICTSSCGNWKIEHWEECDNWRFNWYDWKCSQQCRIVDTNHQCWDGIKDEYEQCDKWKNNWKISSRCTLMCTTYNPLKPNCGNWVIDPGETCLTCPVDLGTKCSARCWNWVTEVWEECDNWKDNGKDWKCSFECKDVGKHCWNKIVDAWEDCSNCSTDIGSCTSSCGNWTREPGEECDSWKLNWYDGKCSQYCKIVDTNHKCWDWKQDEYEECDKWTNNWTPSSKCTLMCTSYEEWKPNCGNWKIEAWETCATCPVDLWERCSATCWNWKKEVWEECDNWSNNWYDWKCSFECKATTSKCWNNIKEKWEDCDDWGSNWTKNSKNNCSKKCTTNIWTKVTCWNSTIEWDEECDLWKNRNWKKNYNCTTDCKEKSSCPNDNINEKEKCNNCSSDLKDICINDWTHPWECWNKVIEPWENCTNCPQDVWKCTGFCWNKIIEEAEDCNSCDKDVGSCTSSCGNWIVEPGEECDSWAWNWWDGKCSEYCRIVDPNHECWDWKQDKYEECDSWTGNWKQGSECTYMCTYFIPLNPNCGNWVIDPGETCLTCPVDLGTKCSAICWNWIREICEECDNGLYNWYNWKCSFECTRTTAICWNWKREWNEKCDDWDKNWTIESPNNCSEKCTKIISKNPVCWNWVKEWDEECDLWQRKNWKKNYNCTSECKEIKTCPNNKKDKNEKCETCPEDLWEICITEWKQPWECWNGIIEEWEDCKNCSTDVKNCTSFCWNTTIEEAENCSNCTKDVKNCRWSCWNGKLEAWEECDHGKKNWLDGKCSEYCRIVDSEHECWDGTKDEYEECDKWADNWKITSMCTLMCTKYNPVKPNCGNWKIDFWETCTTCPVDLWEKCSVICWNWKKEIWEECDNWSNNWYDWKCSFECKKTKTKCWDWKVDAWEDCDDWGKNWTANSENNCSIKCTTNISPVPECWNWVKEWDEECDLWKKKNWNKKYNCTYDCKLKDSCPNHEYDKWEDCENCPDDLLDICIDDWNNSRCWNERADNDENCKICTKDVWTCNAYCWNKTVETAEDCKNCVKDLWKCTWSCGNGAIEPGEECDNWSNNNWFDWLCWEDCKIVDPEHYCWNGKREWNEKCDDWDKNWTIESNCTIMCTEKEETKPNCWNGTVDAWETCITCPIDLWTRCLHVCWDWKIDKPREQCDNWENNGLDWKCSFDCIKTKAICWNGIKEWREQCDAWTGNGVWDTCSERCTTITKPVCWNGKKELWEACDYWNRNWTANSICWENCEKAKTCGDGIIEKKETCQNCPEDLKDKCVDDWEKAWCWNEIADGEEHCSTCTKDVWKCNAYCWNKIIEAAENCKNCPWDVWKCTWSCGNGTVEPGEECDNWENNNWYDWLCWVDCKSVNPNQKCWNEKTEWTEKCDDWDKNWTIGSNCTIMCTDKDPLKPNCWNGTIDIWETCATCPIDLGPKCLHACWDWKRNTPREECDNWENNGFDWICWFDCTKTKAICWNGTREGREECDEWTGNGVWDICTEKCKKVTVPECWNGKKEFWEECDYWYRNWLKNSICWADCKKVKTCADGEIQKKETCQICPEDLWERCIAKNVCWNGIKEENEECDDWRWNGINKNCNKYCKKLDKCWNKIIDEWETCQTCRIDVWPCTAKCWNWIIEEAETCLNCPDDVWECTASCWNGILEQWEQCDHGDKNGKDKQCSIKCELVTDKTKPYCWDWNTDTNLWEKCDNWPENWKSNCSYICTEVLRPTSCGNGKIDIWETCATCPLDVGYKCQTKCGNKILDSKREQCDNWTRNGRDWICTTQCQTKKITICWNWTPEEWEECDNWTDNWNDKKCTKKCTKYKPEYPNCWDWIVNDDENCRNCPEDVWACRWSCWNGVVEPGEECDHWSENNGKDNLCDKDCRNIDPNKLCWNGYTNKDEWEECDNGEQNWINGQCSLNCKNVTRPNCGNWKIETDENCNNCPEDLWVKCITYCGNSEIEQWEQCDNWENNGRDWICSNRCTNVKSCWNEVIDIGEDCLSCSIDLKDICVDYWDTCPNWKIDGWENCLNCPNDTKKCSWSCWNGKVEGSEDCDNWTGNWVDWICSADCINVDPLHYCWNNEIEADLDETCDMWEDNGKVEKWCTINCKAFDPDNPTCWNWTPEEWEDCENCPDDFDWACEGKCWDWIVTEPYEECDPKANNWDIECTETCEKKKVECLNWNCNTVCNKSIDKDCDGCDDDKDPCPDLAWDPNWTYKCCPELPPGPPETLCPDGDCPLINPICNQCPCQFADYSNTLQKDDQVRARLRDKWFMVHYNYSQMVNIASFIN